MGCLALAGNALPKQKSELLLLIIKCFQKEINLSGSETLSLQLFALLYRTQQVFEDEKLKHKIFQVLQKVNTKALLQTRHYLLANLETNLVIREVFVDTLKRLIRSHPVLLVYDLLFYLEKKKSVAQRLLVFFANTHPQIYQKAVLFYFILKNSVITLVETIFAELNTIMRLYKENKLTDMLARLICMLENSTNWACYIDQKYLYQFSTLLASVELHTREFLVVQSTGALANLVYTLNLLGLRTKSFLTNLTTINVFHTFPCIADQRFFFPKLGHVRLGSEMSVLSSKQKPRKLVLFDDRNNAFPFLLKGKEDLRMDQRLMELVRVAKQLAPPSHRAEIPTYTILPLTPSFGLVEWLQNFATLSELIRETRKAQQKLEVGELAFLNAGVDFNRSTFIRRLERLAQIGLRFSASDLPDAMLATSNSPEEFSQKQTAFCNSLAFVTVFCYFVGLGDRHPGNLMLNRDSFVITNIDFGDGFETARLRDRLPEIVPARLTKVLLNGLSQRTFHLAFLPRVADFIRLFRKNKGVFKVLFEVFAQDPVELAGSAVKLNVGKVLNRVSEKLEGNDFGQTDMGYEEQALRLVQESTSLKNLSFAYIGWCPYL